MAELIGIAGDPGSGKSTSLKGLPPDKTVYVDCDCKGLNFKGWKKLYSQDNPIIFATQRGYGDFEGWWEFPGDKIEAGESPQEALKREIMEELATEIIVGDLIHTIEYDYPTFHLSMDCFWCELESGDLVLKEHEAARWMDKSEFGYVNWLPADIELIGKIAESI